MKTKPLSLLLALAFSAPLAAADLCGGADDDQNTGIPGFIELPATAPAPGPAPAMIGPRPVLLPICGGMDDDQLRRNALPPAIQQLNRMSDEQIFSLLMAKLQGDDGDDTLHGNDGDDTLAGAVPAGLWGDNGTDSLSADFLIHYLERRHATPNAITGDAGDDIIQGPTGVPARIVGGDGADFVKPVISGGNGNDSIYGEGGADSIVGGGDADFLWLRMVFGPVSGLWGGGAVDELIGGSWDTPMEVP